MNEDFGENIPNDSKQVKDHTSDPLSAMYTFDHYYSYNVIAKQETRWSEITWYEELAQPNLIYLVTTYLYR